MMTGCVAGRDDEDLRRRLAAYRDVAGNEAPPLAGTVDELADRLREFERAGVERVMLQHLVHEDVEMVHVLGELATRLR